MLLQKNVDKAEKKYSYVSAVAGGQKKSHPGGRDCFFLGNHPIVSVRYVYLVISETKEKRFTDYLVLPERDGW